MAKSPLRQRIVAIGAFYAMYVMIRWWMMRSYRLCRSIESRSSPIDDFDFVEEPVQDVCRSEGPTSSVTSKRKRRKNIDGYEIYRESCKEMKEVLVRFGEIVVEHLNKEGLEAREKGLEAREIFEKVNDELKALPGITMTKRFKAVHLIGKDVVLGRLFLGLTQEEKINMVESYTDSSMG